MLLVDTGASLASRILVVAVLTCVIASTSNAQWTFVSLRPAGATQDSFAQGVGSGQQVGYEYVGSTSHASLWNGSAASWVDLTPAQATGHSWAYDADGGQQVGWTVVGSGDRASLWTSTAASWLNLHPPGPYILSQAWGVGGGQQVGWVHDGGQYLASLWSGTAASWVNLRPIGVGPGIGDSRAFGVGDGKQVGYVTVNANTSQPTAHASLWSGTAASWVDLGANFGSGESKAYGVKGGQQVGYAVVGGVVRASLWRGTAVSWVDLTPAGANSAEAWGVAAGQQVGWANFTCGVTRAGLWSGTASSWVDLHAFLPEGFISSRAHGIWNDGTFSYVVGEGYNSASGRNEAVMWVQTALTAGACCQGTTCVLAVDGACAVGQFRGIGSTCGTQSNPTTCCPANFDGIGGLGVADIFSFLSAWFAGNPRADFNGQDCVNVQDIFAFLAAWFTGC